MNEKFEQKMGGKRVSIIDFIERERKYQNLVCELFELCELGKSENLDIGRGTERLKEEYRKLRNE